MSGRTQFAPTIATKYGLPRRRFALHALPLPAFVPRFVVASFVSFAPTFRESSFTPLLVVSPESPAGFAGAPCREGERECLRALERVTCHEEYRIPRSHRFEAQRSGFKSESDEDAVG